MTERRRGRRREFAAGIPMSERIHRCSSRALLDRDELLPQVAQHLGEVRLLEPDELVDLPIVEAEVDEGRGAQRIRDLPHLLAGERDDRGAGDAVTQPQEELRCLDAGGVVARHHGVGEHLEGVLHLGLGCVISFEAGADVAGRVVGDDVRHHRDEALGALLDHLARSRVVSGEDDHLGIESEDLLDRLRVAVRLLEGAEVRRLAVQPGDERGGQDLHAAAAAGDVVHHHRLPVRRLGDLEEVVRGALLRRLVVVRRDGHDAIGAGLDGVAGVLDRFPRAVAARARDDGNLPIREGHGRPHQFDRLDRRRLARGPVDHDAVDAGGYEPFDHGLERRVVDRRTDDVVRPHPVKGGGDRDQGAAEDVLSWVHRHRSRSSVGGGSDFPYLTHIWGPVNA